MDVGSYLPLLFPLLAVPLVLHSARRLHPAVATWLTSAAAAVLALGTAITLALFTVAGLVGLSTVADRGHADITNLPVDATSAILLLAMCVTGTVAAAQPHHRADQGERPGRRRR